MYIIHLFKIKSSINQKPIVNRERFCYNIDIIPGLIAWWPLVKDSLGNAILCARTETTKKGDGFFEKNPANTKKR